MLMHKINLDSLNQKEQYKLLSASIVPRPIAWITTINSNESINLAPFSFFSIVSNQIPLISISINRKDTVLKDSAENILRTKEAVIHIPSINDLESMNATAASHPKNQSELDLINYNLLKSSSFQTPALKEPKIRLETKLYQHIEIKDRDSKLVSDLFLMWVDTIHIDEEIYDEKNNYILQEKLQVLARLGGNYYSSSDNFHTAERPK